MAANHKKVGLLYGPENHFPKALRDYINRKGEGKVLAEPIEINRVMQGRGTDYDVIIDRISHEYPFYRSYLKNAGLTGTAVINNPFWWSADDKFFNNCLAVRTGVTVPRTVLLPSKEHQPGTINQTYRNMKFPLDWDGIFDYVGFPAFFKPFAGGGWKHVYRVESPEAFFKAYDESGTLVMMLQEEIEFSEYFRCFCIGSQHVRLMEYEPRNPHHLRYVRNAGPIESRLKGIMEEAVLSLNRSLGYDFNTVEMAIREGIPYAIDFGNPVPDADPQSLGDEHFEWVVSTLGAYAIERALDHEPGKDNLTWGTFVKKAAW
jgi:glutathione synthase/RimK-type ligase-like ATP-grasp enzyme